MSDTGRIQELEDTIAEFKQYLADRATQLQARADRAGDTCFQMEDKNQ